MRAPRHLTAAVAVALVAVAAPVPPGTTARWVQQAPVALAPVVYEAPVTAPVTDTFRPPATPYGPGNRGLEFATEPGGPVAAAAAGTVVFAGPVAGTLHVTVLHADGARTTYGGLATTNVARGEDVAGGQPVGTAARTLLWTVRLGGAYLDPAVLLAASGQVRAHLVPVSDEWPLEGRAAPP